MDRIEQELENAKADINSILTQLQMMNPAGYIEFKGQVLATLQSVVNSISALHDEYKSMADNKDSVLENIRKASSANDTEIKVMKAQAALIAFFVSLIMGAISIAIAYFKK